MYVMSTHTRQKYCNMAKNSEIGNVLVQTKSKIWSNSHYILDGNIVSMKE